MNYPPYNIEYVLRENTNLKQENLSLRLEIQILKTRINELEQKKTLPDPLVPIPASSVKPVDPVNPVAVASVNYYCNLCKNNAFTNCIGTVNGEICNKWFCKNCMKSKWYDGKEYFYCINCFNKN